MSGAFSIAWFTQQIEPVAVRYCPATCCNGAIYPSIPGEKYKLFALYPKRRALARCAVAGDGVAVAIG